MAYTQEYFLFFTKMQSFLSFTYNYNVNQDFHATGGVLQCNLSEMISFPEINCTPANQLNQKARVKHHNNTIYRIRLDLSLYPFHHCTKTAPYFAHFGAVRLRFGVFSVVIACSPGRCRSRRGQLLQEFLLSSVIKRRHILTLQSSQEDIINPRVWNRGLLTIACFRRPCFVCCQWKFGRPLVVRSRKWRRPV